jgi:hypothetical protein
MINIILGVFIGVFLGIVIEKYLFLYLDMVFEIFTYKQSEKATKHQINAQRIAYDFYREYPEALEETERQDEQQTHAIGFQYEPKCEEYEDDI